MWWGFKSLAACQIFRGSVVQWTGLAPSKRSISVRLRVELPSFDSVAQWTERRFPKPVVSVRIRPESPSLGGSDYRSYGLCRVRSLTGNVLDTKHN